MPIDPVAAGVLGTQFVGGVMDYQNQKEQNRETRKQNKFDRDLSSLQNRINLREYFANQPLTEAERQMKLDEIRKQRLLQILQGGGL